jgi:hypothetical protein
MAYKWGEFILMTRATMPFRWAETTLSTVFFLHVKFTVQPERLLLVLQLRVVIYIFIIYYFIDIINIFNI